ncbi:MAG TPA: PIN domain-containing protein [Leucothrix sp.]|nr:PIN domain-containing protein [Leucothrix sp.]
MEKAWVDTGFLVALFARNDSHHEEAKAFIKDNQSLEMHSIWPVIVEACFFLNNQGKQALLKWVERGALTMHDITPRDTPLIREVIEQYKNIDPDFTDATLVALAGQSKIRKILTVDKRDFSIYHFVDGSSFERLWVK